MQPRVKGVVRAENLLYIVYDSKRSGLFYRRVLNEEFQAIFCCFPSLDHLSSPVSRCLGPGVTRGTVNSLLLGSGWPSPVDVSMAFRLSHVMKVR